MKTLTKKTILTLGAGFFISYQTFANHLPIVNNNTEVATCNMIKKRIKLSDNYINLMNGQNVLVTFTVNEEGHVNLAIANSPNNEIKQIIESQFLTLDLKHLKSNEVYSIAFNFKTLK